MYVHLLAGLFSSELPLPHVHTDILGNLRQKCWLWQRCDGLCRIISGVLPLWSCHWRAALWWIVLQLRLLFKVQTGSLWGSLDKIRMGCSGCPNTKILARHLNTCKQQYNLTKEVYINDTTRQLQLHQNIQYLHFWSGAEESSKIAVCLQSVCPVGQSGMRHPLMHLWWPIYKTKGCISSRSQHSQGCVCCPPLHERDSPPL